MRRIFLILPFVFLCSLRLLAAPKDAEAVYEKLVIEYSLDPNGTIVKHVERDMILNTSYAILQARKESVLTFDPQHEDLVINSSYLRGKDGSIMLTEAPVRQGKAVVNLDEAKPGCVAVLDYTIVSTPKEHPGLDVTIPLEFQFPADEIIVCISVPEEETLSYEFSLAPSIPVESIENGMKKYRWTFKNVPQLPDDKGAYTISELHASTEGIAPDKPNSEISGIVLKKLTYNIDLTYGHEILKANYAVVTLPFAEDSFTGEPYATYPVSRSRELIIGQHISTSTTYHIKLKDGIKVSGLQNLNRELSNVAGYYSCQAEVSGNMLTVVRTLEIYESVIPAEDYEAFHELVAAWACENHIQLTTLIAEGMTSIRTGVRPHNSPSTSMKEKGEASISILRPLA